MKGGGGSEEDPAPWSRGLIASEKREKKRKGGKEKEKKGIKIRMKMGGK